MLDILKDQYFNEHYCKGFVETNISLPDELVDEIKDHYSAKVAPRNDFPKFFANNEHQAYLDDWKLGFLFTNFPAYAKKKVKELYDSVYDRAVYCDMSYIDRVIKYLFENDFSRFFKARYFVVTYDIYLRNNHRLPAAGIHTDLPNFHQFYETENDLTLYMPLVDLDDDNGGRLRVLPESKLKVPGNILLKLMYEYFSEKPEYLDENGYVDPDLIGPPDIASFVKSKPYQDLMNLYKGIITLARKQYADDFHPTVETKGKLVLFNNKNFHDVERWKNEQMDRQVYIIRMVPLYDAKINLKTLLHGTRINKCLLDMKTGEIHKFDQRVDITQIPDDYKLPL